MPFEISEGFIQIKICIFQFVSKFKSVSGSHPETDFAKKPPQERFQERTGMTTSSAEFWI